MGDIITHMAETAILTAGVGDILDTDMGLDMGVTHIMITHTIMDMDLTDIFKNIY